jgi:hypothetical protein
MTTTAAAPPAIFVILLTVLFMLIDGAKIVIYFHPRKEKADFLHKSSVPLGSV